MQSRVSGLKAHLNTSRENTAKVLASLPGRKKQLEDEAVIRYRPAPVSTLSVQSERTTISEKVEKPLLSTHSSPQLSLSVPAKCPEREGWLFKKLTPKNALAATPWTRRYFTLRNGGITYSFHNVNGRNRGVVLTTRPLNVLMCEIRPRTDRSEERRFLFEVSSPRKIWTLQAENEQEMKDWIRDFELAKLFAMKDDSFRDVVDELVEVDSESEEEEGERFVPIKKGATIKSAQTKRTGGEDSAEILDPGNQVESSRLPLTAEIAVQDDKKVEPFVYPDVAMQRRNEELHTLLKSVPKTDYVIEVFTCAFQKDILLHGKIFLTQNRICFYSNILGYVTILIVHLNECLNIQRKRQPLNSSIVFSTTSGQVCLIYMLGEQFC